MNDKYIWALDRLMDESAKKLLAPIINEAAAKAVKKAGKPMTTEEWEEYKPEYGSDYAQAIHVFNKLNLLSTKPVPGKMYYVFTPTVADTITIPPKQPMIAQYLGSRSGNYVFKTPNEREVALPGVTNTPDDNGVTGTIIISNTERYDLMRQYLKNKFGVDIPPVSKPSGSTVAAEDASTKMFLEADEESDEPKVVRRKTQQQDGSTNTHWVVLDYSGEMAGGQGNGFSDLSAARAFLKANRKKLSAPPDDINEELIDEDLRKWFKEKWVRFNPQGKIMGPCARGDDSEGKPKCLPQSKAHSLGKKGRASAAARKRREDPNPERSGAAINVNTKKKKANEGVNEAYMDLELSAIVEGCSWDSVVEWLNKNVGPTTIESPNWINGYHGQGWRLYPAGYSDKSGKIALKVSVNSDKIRILSDERLKDVIEASCGAGSSKQLDELKCWPGYTRVPGVPAGAPFSCKKKKVKKTTEAVDEGSYKRMSCPECGGPAYEDQMIAEEKDACYHKVKSRYRVWPSAYASGALSKCRKVGAKNWGNKGKK